MGNNFNPDAFKRLNDLAVMLYGGLPEIARHMGKAHTYFYTYKNKNASFGSKFYAELENKAGISAKYIQYGIGTPFAETEMGSMLRAKYEEEIKNMIDLDEEASYSVRKDNSSQNNFSAASLKELFEATPPPFYVPEMLFSLRAGSPTINLSTEVSGYRNMSGTFIATISGDSMADYGMADGDQILLKRTSQFRNGDVIAARINDSLTLKRAKQNNSELILVPGNKNYDPIPVLPTDDFECLGIWEGGIFPYEVVKKLRRWEENPS